MALTAERHGLPSVLGLRALPPARGARVVPIQTEIDRLAQQLITRYGAGAGMRAEHRASKLELLGDLGAPAIWRRVHAAILIGGPV